MIKLKDKLGTMYIHRHFIGPMEAIFKEYQSEVIDLADCRFMPDAEKVLRKYYLTNTFCNTERGCEEWDRILKSNCEAARQPTVQTVPLPFDVHNSTELCALWETMSVDVVYNIDEYRLRNSSSRRVRAMTILTTIFHPEFTIDLGASAKQIFEAVRADWLGTGEQCEQYIEVDGNAVFEVTINREANGIRLEESEWSVYRPGYGNRSLRDYIRDYCVLPKYFGEEPCDDNENMRLVISTAIRDLFTEEVHSPKMKDFIVEAEQEV